MSAETFLEKVERRLTKLLSDDNLNVSVSNGAISNPLAEGMRYAVLGGGKRIRPMAVYLGAEAVGADMRDDGLTDSLAGYACALELVHSYSLVHDDLPAMDNDDFRRGKLSTHNKFGEANGILIGDALLNEAANVLLRSACSGKEFLESAAMLMRCASDMAAGQAFDLETADCESCSEDKLLRTYSLKTGALFRAAFVGGAKIANAKEDELTEITNYAKSFGLVFQLTDDLLDEGKEFSYVTAAGVEKTKSLIQRETAAATEAAKKLPNPDGLVRLLKSLANRKK